MGSQDGGADGGSGATDAAKKDNLYENRPGSKKIIRVVTVMAYMVSVSFVAIVLSAYYIFLWQPPNPRLLHRDRLQGEPRLDYLADVPPIKLSIEPKNSNNIRDKINTFREGILRNRGIKIFTGPINTTTRTSVVDIFHNNNSKIYNGISSNSIIRALINTSFVNSTNEETSNETMTDVYERITDDAVTKSSIENLTLFMKTTMNSMSYSSSSPPPSSSSPSSSSSSSSSSSFSSPSPSSSSSFSSPSSSSSSPPPPPPTPFSPTRTSSSVSIADNKSQDKLYKTSMNDFTLRPAEIINDTNIKGNDLTNETDTNTWQTLMENSEKVNFYSTDEISKINERKLSEEIYHDVIRPDDLTSQQFENDRKSIIVQPQESGSSISKGILPMMPLVENDTRDLQRLGLNSSGEISTEFVQNSRAEEMESSVSPIISEPEPYLTDREHEGGREERLTKDTSDFDFI